MSYRTKSERTKGVVTAEDFEALRDSVDALRNEYDALECRFTLLVEDYLSRFQVRDNDQFARAVRAE